MALCERKARDRSVRQAPPPLYPGPITSGHAALLASAAGPPEPAPAVGLKATGSAAGPTPGPLTLARARTLRRGCSGAWRACRARRHGRPRRRNGGCAVAAALPCDGSVVEVRTAEDQQSSRSTTVKYRPDTDSGADNHPTRGGQFPQQTLAAGRSIAGAVQETKVRRPWRRLLWAGEAAGSFLPRVGHGLCRSRGEDGRRLELAGRGVHWQWLASGSRSASGTSVVTVSDAGPCFTSRGQ